jgi:hypothetical protein
LAPLLLGALLLGGCLGKPEIEDRWTRIDIASSSLAQGQSLPPGSRTSITVGMDVTYRSILTGVAVAELRASSVPAGAVDVGPDSPRPRMAQDIDLVLQNSRTLGRATRAVTGWDHLIQHIDFTFDGVAPSTVDSSSVGLFLVCYLGMGTEIELPDGSDSLVVTPFVSGDVEVLHSGLELVVGGP